MKSLEEAIELSKDCCEKKDLVVYGTWHDSTCGGVNKTYLVCANCRTQYTWVWDEQVARKSEQRMSDEDLYRNIEYYTIPWRLMKAERPGKYEHAIEYFTKKLGLDRSRIEKIIKDSEIFSEYGYKVEDERDLETEGVTVAFTIYPDKTSNLDSIEKIESAVNKIVQPYKLLTETRKKVEMKNKVFWEPFCSGSRIFSASIKGTFAVSMKGPACEVKRILEYLISNYDLPCTIYKPNRLFENDTARGVEIARDICIKMGGEVKKPIITFFYDKEKYLVLKKKNAEVNFENEKKIN